MTKSLFNDFNLLKLALFLLRNKLYEKSNSNCYDRNMMHTVFVNHLIAVSQFSHLLFSPPTASSCYPELCGKVQSWETERATSPSWQLYFHHQYCTQQTTWRLWGKTCFLFPFLFNWMSVWRSGNTLVSFRCDPDLISGISEHVKLSCGHQVGAVGFLWVLRFSLGTLVSSGYSGFLWVLRFPHTCRPHKDKISVITSGLKY